MALNDANCMMVSQQLLNAVKSFIRLEKSCVKSTGGKGCQTPDVLDGQCLDFTGIELDEGRRQQRAEGGAEEGAEGGAEGGRPQGSVIETPRTD